MLQLGLALEVGERPHVVQPVGELDDNDAHVAAHRHDHLPQGFGLRLLQVPRGQVAELRDPVDDLRDLVAELVGELVLGHARVLEHVVQERRRDGRRVEPELGQDRARRQRVVDERLPALADLSPVGGVRHGVGARDQLLRALRRVGGHLLEQGGYRHRRRRYRPRSLFCACWFHDEIISFSTLTSEASRHGAPFGLGSRRVPASPPLSGRGP